MKYYCPEEIRAKNGFLKYLEELRPLAKTNRHKPTKSELLFWNICLCKDKTGYTFLRQKPIGKYIADFYCSKLLLIIEIDGGSHIGKSYLDQSRDEYFYIREIKTIRYSDKQIEENLKWVVIDLKTQIENRKKELKIK